MPLKDQKIQDNRIRPTPEIGCRAPALRRLLYAGHAHAVGPKTLNWGHNLAPLT
jgi:hypothetical protein